MSFFDILIKCFFLSFFAKFVMYREDVVEYHVAEEKFQEIAKVNREGMGLEALLVQ